MEYLDKTDRQACTGYLEHIINSLGEEGPDFHDKLAELYLDAAKMDMKKTKDRTALPESYSKLLFFLESSAHVRAHRLLNKLVNDDMPEARAILLGKMGNHEEALRIYVYKLHDYTAAETYCAKVYAGEPDPHGIYLTLLHIYLRPAKAQTDIMLAPAIQLIASNGPRIDPQAVLDLLPPLVTMEDVRLFFVRTLRDGYAKKNERRVVKNLASARKEEVERVLMGMQMKRVRIRDQRMSVARLGSPSKLMDSADARSAKSVWAGLPSPCTPRKEKSPTCIVKTHSAPSCPRCVTSSISIVCTVLAYLAQ